MFPFYTQLKDHETTLFYSADKSGAKPFSTLVEKSSALVIITSEITWPPPGLRGKIRYIRLLTRDQLFEAHEGHGIRIYKVLSE